MQIEQFDSNPPASANEPSWDSATIHETWGARQALNKPREKAVHLTPQEKAAETQLKSLLLDVRNVDRALELAAPTGPMGAISEEGSKIEQRARQIVLGLNPEQLHHVAVKLDNDSEIKAVGLRVVSNPGNNHLIIGSRVEGSKSDYSTAWSPYLSTDK